MKKKLLLTISLMLVAVMLMLTGCKSEFEGNYKEATAEQKQEIALKLNSLETVEESKKSNMKLTSSTEVVTDSKLEGTSATATTNLTTIYDNSVEDATKAYIKYEMNYKITAAGNTLSTKTAFEITVDDATKKGYISYSVGGNVGENEISKSGKCYFEYGAYDFGGMGADSIGSYFNEYTDIDFKEIVSLLEENDVKLEVDGNKIKVTETLEGGEVVVYVIFENNDQYKMKVETHSKEGEIEIKANAEMVPTNEKVDLPKDLDNYSQKIDMDSLYSIFRGNIGMM